MPLNQQAKKGVAVLFGVTVSDCQREIGLLLHNGIKEAHVWNIGSPSKCLLLLTCPIIKVSRKLQQPKLSRNTNNLDLSGMKVWVTQPSRVACLLKAKGIQNG